MGKWLIFLSLSFFICKIVIAYTSQGCCMNHIDWRRENLWTVRKVLQLLNLDKGDYTTRTEREENLQRKSKKLGLVTDSITSLSFILQVSYFCSFDIIWGNEITLWSIGSLSGHYQLFIHFLRATNNHLFSLFIILTFLQHIIQTPFLLLKNK